MKKVFLWHVISEDTEKYYDGGVIVADSMEDAEDIISGTYSRSDSCVYIKEVETNEDKVISINEEIEEEIKFWNGGTHSKPHKRGEK